MPKLRQNSSGEYYFRTLNAAGQIVTLHITAEGSDWLEATGIEVGDELGTLRWELAENEWLYTRGEMAGGGDIEKLQGSWIHNDALRASPASLTKRVAEPITVPCENEFAQVPRFLFSPHRSIYYTIMYVENSSDYWLQIPVLIKHRGAIELLSRGAVVGDEFTEAGLRLLFERRWAYLDDERVP